MPMPAISESWTPGRDLFDEVDDGVDDRERARLGREALGVLDDAALALDESDRDSSAADVDADRVVGAHDRGSSPSRPREADTLVRELSSQSIPAL